VIIKRTDETRRHPDDTLRTAIREGTEQLKRPVLSLALSSLAAGLLVSFSGMAVAVVTTLMSGTDPAGGEFPVAAVRIATAFVYPLGFIVCILSGAQLFTEHTATALYPVLDGRASIAKLFRLWIVVLAGNLGGAAASGALHTIAADVIQAGPGYLQIGHHLTEFDTLPLLMSAIMAGWLMALGAWLVLASSRMIAEIYCIYVVTFLIGVGGLHHSIAGSAEMFAALFMFEEFTGVQAIRFIAIAVAGNLVGGSVFVALLNYAHIRTTQSLNSGQSDTRS
jgi:formate/nitrite transporter FocA (FNT family)